MARLEPLIHRPRVAALCASARVLVLEAPGGFGKTTLADQVTRSSSVVVRTYLGDGDGTPSRLAARLRDGARDAELELVVEAGVSENDPLRQLDEIGRALVRDLPTGGAVIIENAHVLVADALSALRTLAEHLSPAVLLVVCGRSIGEHLPSELRLGPQDLAFTAAETAELMVAQDIVDDDLAHSVNQRCAGWPSAVGLTVTAMERGQVSFTTPLQLESLVTGLLDAGPPIDSRLTAALGQLPVISDRIGDALGIPHLIATVLAIGLPIRSTGGWWRLADPVREFLATSGPLPRDDLAIAAGVIFAGGETTTAIDLLVDAERFVDMTRLIADVEYAALDLLEVDELAVMLEAAPTAAVEANPRCLLQLARAAESRVRIELRTRLLLRLAAIVPEIGDARLARELEAEHVCDLSRDSRVDETVERARALMASTAPDELVTRARCLRALGQALAWRGDPRSLVEASHVLAEAAGTARMLNHALWRADALCTLGFFVFFARGEFEQAVQRMSEGVQLLGRRSRRRAVQLTFLADILTLLGRDDEAMAALADARTIGRAYADERILGYAAWEQARAVARTRDVRGTLRWLAEAERHPGDWMDHPTGSQFLAEAAEIAAMVGATDVAYEYLRRATAHAAAQGWPEIPEVASGVLAARFGDPQEAEGLLARSAENAYLNRANEWRVTLLVAHARLRHGDAEGARVMAAAVVDLLDTLGHPELAMLHEAEIWPPLLRLLDGTRSPTLTIGLLGGFRITQDGDGLVVQAGRTAQLVKMVAVAGRPLPVDELVEQLWPTSPPDVGRRRLRNVLARVRAAAPVIDRSDDFVALVPGVVVDAHAFERRADLALSASEANQLQLAEEALALYVGNLLPGDRAEDWTTVARERLERRAIRLLSLVADRAEAAGHVDRAVDAIDAMCSLDPFDDELPLRAARLLSANGQRARAGAWAQRCVAIRIDLGLDVPADPMRLIS
ncbi:MAG: hypothetical protein JWN62_4151 [Acidimicrobiales bacterium]|nr:hypothetical protein [Acidimicrobiales bacterium]